MQQLSDIYQSFDFRHAYKPALEVRTFEVHPITFTQPVTLLLHVNYSNIGSVHLDYSAVWIEAGEPSFRT
jgi:hypothetical protein